MNSSFIMLLALVIFLGAGFGGSFVGGVIYGQNQADNADEELSPRLGAGGQFPGGGQGANAAQRGQGRQGQGSGASAEQGQRGGFAGGQGTARQEGGPGNAAVGAGRGTVGAPDVQANTGGNAANSSPAVVSSETGRAAEGTAQGNANRGGAVGTIQGLEGDVLTVSSPRGELAVMLSESTRVFQVSETDRESLEAETNVRVVGSRNPEGGIAAQSVIIVPEGAENLFGGGGPGGRQRGQAR